MAKQVVSLPRQQFELFIPKPHESEIDMQFGLGRESKKAELVEE